MQGVGVTDFYATRRGEARPAAKMTARKVRVMRYAHGQKLATQSELAELFRIARSTTSLIIQRKAWKHIE